MPKLVKNSKIVNLPHARRDVKSTLRKAMLHAEREGWTKLIILGEGKDCVRSLYSNMDNYTAIGMLEIEKSSCAKDILDS